MQSPLATSTAPKSAKPQEHHSSFCRLSRSIFSIRNAVRSTVTHLDFVRKVLEQKSGQIDEASMLELGRFNGYPTEQDPVANTIYWTDQVGSHVPNAWGLCDMHGNLAELCLDWWSDLDWWRENYLDPAQVTDPKGPPSGVGRILRGGTSTTSEYNCRSAYRNGRVYAANPTSDVRAHGHGFRIAVHLDQ